MFKINNYFNYMNMSRKAYMKSWKTYINIILTVTIKCTMFVNEILLTDTYTGQSVFLFYAP